MHFAAQATVAGISIDDPNSYLVEDVVYIEELGDGFVLWLTVPDIYAHDMRTPRKWMHFSPGLTKAGLSLRIPFSHTFQPGEPEFLFSFCTNICKLL